MAARTAWTRILGVGLVLGAFGGCATAPTAEGTARGPVETEAALAVRVERPSFFVGGVLDDGAFRRWAAEIPLPAVSEDGAYVALGQAGEDGARANANYRVRIVRVADGSVLLEVTVLGADEAEAAVEASDGETPPSALEGEVLARVDRVNAALAERRWVRLGRGLDDLAPAGPDEDRPFGEPFPGPLGLAAEGFSVVFEAPRLVVKRGDAVLVEASHPEWLAPEASMCAPEEEEGMSGEERAELCACHNPATLERGAVDLARGVLWLRIAYLGSDICWEPDTIEVVVPLPK